MTSRTPSAAILLTVFALALSAVAERVVPHPSTAELLRTALRFPVMTVPLLPTAPVIDGRVDEEEWAGAALLPDFMTLYSETHEGAASPYRCRVWLLYTPQALYVAMRADYPTWSDPIVGHANLRDQRSTAEDRFDMNISPYTDLYPSQCWQLGGNANSALYDQSLMSGGYDVAWSPAVEYRSRHIEGGWEGEYMLPFSALDVPVPQPGDCWRANMVSTRMSPARAYSTWAPASDFRALRPGAGHGWLRFGADATAVRFESGLDQLGPKSRHLLLTGFDSPPTTSLALLKRTDTFTGQSYALLRSMTDWERERNTGGSAFLGASLQDLIDEVLSRFEPAEPPMTRPTHLTAGTATFDAASPSEPGEYLARYSCTASDPHGEQVLAAGAVSYRVRPPIDITLRPMLLSSELMDITVYVTDMPNRPQADTVSIDVLKQGTATPVYTQRADINGQEPTLFQVPAQLLPVGSYDITASVYNLKDETLATVARHYDRPPTPSWWTHPVEDEPMVPAPWTDIEVLQTTPGQPITVRVWGREYRFDGLPVPASVTTTPARYSTGEPQRDPVALLARPMAFQLRRDGQPEVLSTDAMRVTEATPSRVVLTSHAHTDTLSIRGTTTIEFDGLVKVDLDIAPRNGTSRVDGLDFVIPFKQEYAQFVGNFKTAPGPTPKVNRYLGSLPDLPWTFPVFYAQTVGTDRMGLQWVCDSTRDWRQSKPQEGMVMRQVGEAIEEVFRLIDYPVTLDQPLHITFGLMALPLKPLPQNWGRLRISSSSFGLPPDYGAKDIADFKRLAAYMKPDVELAHNPGWSDTPWYPYQFKDPARQEAMRQQVALYHESGIRYLPHSGWQAISTLIPEWANFAKEMTAEPDRETIGKTIFACYNSPYSAFTASLWDLHARTLGIDGVKADTMFPQTLCNSLHHGCGWFDERGALWPSVNIFATRDFMKRLYRIFHGSVRKDGMSNAAQTGVPIAPICSFTDIVNISEGWPYHHADTLKEGYPQDLVRTLMVGAQYGVITIHDLKGSPLNANQRSAALLVAGAEPRYLPHISHYTRSYVKRAPTSFGFTTPVCDIWDTWDWIDRSGAAIWMPYWENGDVLSLPAPRLTNGQPALVYGSLYAQPGKKIVLILANYETEPVILEPELSSAALGFMPGDHLYAEDAITRIPIEIVDGRLRVGVLSERYRMVKVWVGAPPRYHASRLGPNLFPDGDFESWSPQGASLLHPPGQIRSSVWCDLTTASSGSASLCLTKVTPDWNNGIGAVRVSLPPITLPPGDYVLQGKALITTPFGIPMSSAGNLRVNDAIASASVSGAGITYDPPRWASNHSGTTVFEEPTPGWDPFMIEFRVDNKPQPVILSLALGGIGEIRFDDMTLNAVVVP
ncbi:MAG: hypothetical protein HQ523_04345 [Lentisphaerae bacterium]|nr:hypothetical protein [Lentisphaerota bacterium]